MMRFPMSAALVGVLLLGRGSVRAQGTLADYQRGQELARTAPRLVVDVPGAANWIGETDHFWYSRSVKGGTEFVLVDAGAATKKPAFDHEKLAAAISSASGNKYTALTLPFAPPPAGRGGAAGRGATTGAPTTSPLTFIDGERSIRFGSGGFLWTCSLTEYACTKGGAIPPRRSRRPRRPPAAGEDDSQANPEPVGGDPVDGLEYQPPPPQQGAAGQGGSGPRSKRVCAARPIVRRATRTGPWRPCRRRYGQTPAEPQVCTSFDGKWEALIENFNVFLRPAGSTQRPTALSFDGSEGNYYTLPLHRLVARFQKAGGLSHAPRLRPAGALHRIVAHRPASAQALVHLSTASRATRWISPFQRSSTWKRKSRSEIDHALFPNAYNLTPPVWWKDSRGFTFEYNQRGHQVYRVIEVDAQSGKARALINEESTTFIYYNLLGEGLSGRPPLPLRFERRQGNHLGLGARRLGASLSLRRRHRQGEEPDHQGRTGWCATSIAWMKTSGRSGSRRAA